MQDPIWLAAVVLVIVQSIMAATIARRALGAKRKTVATEFALLALSAAGALWVAKPYLHAGQVGAGDSYHYGLQVADFVTQLRAGIFPVFIGQSEYAFNGNVHTLRTAPYFTLFAGLLDVVTLRQLSFVALQNLAAVLSITGAAVGAALCTRLLAPRQRALAVVLGFLYAACPALSAALFGSDMFATAMAAPWIPFFFTGLALSLDRLDDTSGLLLSVPSLGLIWYAHPAIGAWLTLPLIGIQAWRLLFLSGGAGNLARPFFGAAWLAVMLAYLLYSVESLSLGYHSAHAGDETVSALLSSVQSTFPDVLLPINLETGFGNFQLGYGLTFALSAGLLALWSCGAAGKGLLLTATFLLVATFPFPGLTSLFWSWVPHRLVEVTNVWPMQRFYLMLSGLAVVVAALAAGRQVGPSRRKSWLLGLALVAACGWSAAEVTKFHGHVARSTISTEESILRFSPENVTLTRSSYILFGWEPSTFSHGWVDPEFASGLLDEAMTAMTDNTTTLLTRRTSLEPRLPLTPLVQATPVVIPPGRDTLLRFEFADPAVTGEIKLQGDGIQRNYSLPISGRPRAFGATAEASHTLTLRAAPDRKRTVTISTAASGVTVEALDFDSSILPIRIRSLTPYTATVDAPRAGFLETPYVFVPGYMTVVNGRQAPAERSPSGMVAAEVPAGRSEVVITHPGAPYLQSLWWLSLAGFIATPFVALGVYRHRPTNTASDPVRLDALRRHHVGIVWKRTPLRHKVALLTTIGLVAALLAAWSWYRLQQQEAAAFGSIRLTVELPTSGNPQPLVITGRTGAADCLYFQHEADGRVRFGIDHWGVGGPLSEPIQLKPARYHTIELTQGGLFPAGHRDHARFSSQTKPSTKAPVGPLRLVVDGQLIFELDHPFHPANAAEVYLGTNPIGVSVCGPIFTGRIVRSERFWPDFLR